MSKQMPRYPGAQPFETDQQGIFFGRQKDVESLGRLVRQEPLTVLYSKSGLGKSSLLNAGVIPAIQAEGEYRPLRFRFNAFDKDAPLEGQPMPAIRTMETIRGGKASATTFLDCLIENEATIWHDLKEQQLLAFMTQPSNPQSAIRNPQSKLLLVFDQFEELFTYPPEAVLAFRKQLAEALYTPLPRRYWDMLDLYGKEQSPLSHDEQTLLETPLDLRVVVAIRQDRMHLLGNLNDYLPTISKTWFELQPLNDVQAKEAIIQPAALVGNYLSAPFQYEAQALADILHFLTKGGKEKIESTQLQIVCNSLERKAAAQKLSHIRPADVGDLDAVIENYYLEKIASIGDEEEQLAARRLVEEGLVYEEEERRLSLYEGIILKVYDIAPDTLRKLVDSHLLRAEPSLQGGYTYELSHDTLVAPVLKAKAKRIAAEKLEAEQEALRIKELELVDLRRKAEEERQKAEREKQLREIAEVNEQRSRQRTRLAAIVSVIALGLAVFAGFLNYKNEKIINAFYFYGGRFALAFGSVGPNEYFYFIDKNGDVVTELGQWDNAEQFDWMTGFAKVKKEVDGELKDFLLDILGNSYPVAYDLKDLNDSITALDLSENELAMIPEEDYEWGQLNVLLLHSNRLSSLPESIGELKNLTELVLTNNQLSTLPKSIGELKSLTSLDLDGNQLSSLPESIGELKSLTWLDLNSNPIQAEEIEKLRAALPNCRIIF